MVIAYTYMSLVYEIVDDSLTEPPRQRDQEFRCDDHDIFIRDVFSLYPVHCERDLLC